VSKDGWIVLDTDIQTDINFGNIKSKFGIDPACFAATPDAKHGYYSNCLATPTFEILADFNNNGNEETVISFP
jgi:DNA-binding beta-propeller fold protein YncE